MLRGGVANRGQVVRVGPHVLRPVQPAFAVHLRLPPRDADHRLRRRAATGWGIEPDGHERLEYVEGEAPAAPYPSWALTDEALTSVAELIARFHRASAAFDPTRAGLTWNDEIADVRSGPIVCHNDVCLENVGFREGLAVALVDFDFCAPGRPVYDLAQFARMSVPIDDDERRGAARLGPPGPAGPAPPGVRQLRPRAPGTATSCSRSSTTPWPTAGSSSSVTRTPASRASC